MPLGLLHLKSPKINKQIAAAMKTTKKLMSLIMMMISQAGNWRNNNDIYNKSSFLMGNFEITKY
jgi:hypothetical protein